MSVEISASWWGARIDAHRRAVDALAHQLTELQAIADVWVQALASGGKILLLGNGGSAADAQHLAAELVGRLQRPRAALPALALSANTSILTAVGNDEGFERIFARQIEALGRPGDVVVALSTSGRSPNVLAALEAARRLGLVTVLLTGGGAPADLPADHVLRIDAADVARIQEIHQLVGHMLCERAEALAIDAPAEAPIPLPAAPAYFKHPSSYVDEGAEVGPGTRIWHFSHVQPGARIGAKCNLGQNVNVDRGAVLGDNVKVQNNVSIYNGVIVGDDAFLGPSCVFTNVVNPRSHVPRKDAFRPTRVGRGASIGANATVICGHDVGDYAFVGAGAVVSRDVPAYALVTGVPARLAGWMCSCGEKLPIPAGGRGAGPDEVACEVCAARYRLAGGALSPLPA